MIEYDLCLNLNHNQAKEYRKHQENQDKSRNKKKKNMKKNTRKQRKFIYNFI